MYEGGDHFPKLKGKAAEVRYFVIPLLIVFQRHMPADSVIHRQVLLALRCSLIMEQILDEHAAEFVWAPQHADRFLQAALDFLSLQTGLGAHFQQQGRLLFLTTIKSHVPLHIALLARHQSPRLAWCYAGEDMMHRMRSMVGAAQRGTNPVLVVPKVMRKYLWAISYDVAAERGWWR